MSYSPHFYARTTPLSPIERTVIRPVRVVEETTRVTRNRSFEPLHRGLLSNKVPLTFNPAGITVHPIPVMALQGEDKVSLYSEVERLTMFNLELKKQNEILLFELDQNKALAVRVPELETMIHNLQNELFHREETHNHTVREHELLRADHANLSRLGPAYNELLDHNKALIMEVDALDLKLTDILHERDLLEARAESVKVLKPQLEDATRTIDLMTQDLLGRDQEIIDCRARIEELTLKINTLMLQNEQVHGRANDYLRERDILAGRIEELERVHEVKLVDLRHQMETSNRAFMEQERTQITEKYSIDVMKLQEELNQSRKLSRDLEAKLVLLATEVEHLEMINLSKAGEIDDYKMRLALLEDEKHEIKRITEVDSCLKVEKELGQQRAHYEGIVAQLKRDISDLESVRVLIRQKENEIEMLRAQYANNEKVWEMRLQQAVDNEVKSASNKFVLEMSMLETEASINKDTAMKLESQIILLSTEIERLTTVQNQKIIEINELQRKLASQEVSFRMSLEEHKAKFEIEKKKCLDELRRDLERVHMDRVDEMRRFQVTLEEKVLNLIDENNRLSEIAEHKTKDVDTFSVKLRVMEDVHKQQIDEVQKKSVMSQRIAVEKELSATSAKHRSEKVELECKVAQLTADLERLRAQYHLQSVESERMAQDIKDKELELQQEKRRYVELEIQRTRDINEVREQFDSYKRANVDVNTLQVRFEAERASQASQIMQSKEKVSELEKRLTLFLGENEKMRELYTEKTNELEALRLKYRELEENSYCERENLEKATEHLKRAALDGKEVSIRFTSEKAQYENQIKQLKIINENGKQELEKLYELMNQRKKEYDHYVKQNEDLKREVDRLSRQLREAGSETSTRKDRYEEFERSIAEIERDRDLYREHNERLNTQLQQTNVELQEKIREMDAAKRKYDESISKLSTQLDKDLMKKLMGSSIVTVNTAPGKKERFSVSGMDF